MKINFRDAKAEDFGRCVEIRGMTRDNLVPAKILKEIGVTEDMLIRISSGATISCV